MRKDNISLVTLDMTPAEAQNLVTFLTILKRLCGPDLGLPAATFLDTTMGHIRRQLKQLNWPHGHERRAPFPL